MKNLSRLIRGLAAIVAFPFAVFLAGCNGEFDPRAPLNEQMVVFSIFSTDRQIQFVRVEQSYMPSDFNPLSYSEDNTLRDAIVSVKALNGVYFLRDTLLPRPVESRYAVPLHAYVLNPFTPQRGRTYEVIVQSRYHGMASASVIVPGQSKISIDPPMVLVLDRPDRYPQDAPIVFVAQLSGDSKGYATRLLLYYDVLKGTKWVEERAEIPIGSADSSSYSLDIPWYPQFAAAPKTFQTGAIYRNGYYRAIVNKINSQYRSNRLTFKWTTFVVLQADKNLFEYYSSTHASMDPYSTRLDVPLVSTVDGGLGVVGAYSLDSLVGLLPGNFWGNR